MARHLGCIVLLALSISPPAWAVDKRPITPHDLWAMKRLGAPALSPDGATVAFTVQEWSVEKNKSTTNIWLVDVAGGDKVPRKGGPGVTNADLLVINKTDLAPLVGADLSVMAGDAAVKRGDRPVILCSLVEDPTAAEVAGWVRSRLAE